MVMGLRLEPGACSGTTAGKGEQQKTLSPERFVLQALAMVCKARLPQNEPLRAADRNGAVAARLPLADGPSSLLWSDVCD